MHQPTHSTLPHLKAEVLPCTGDWGSDLCGICGERGHAEPSPLVSRDLNSKEWSLYDWLYATLSATFAFDRQSSIQRKLAKHTF